MRGRNKARAVKSSTVVIFEDTKCRVVSLFMRLTTIMGCYKTNILITIWNRSVAYKLQWVFTKCIINNDKKSRIVTEPVQQSNRRWKTRQSYSYDWSKTQATINCSSSDIPSFAATHISLYLLHAFLTLKHREINENSHRSIAVPLYCCLR